MEKNQKVRRRYNNIVTFYYYLVVCYFIIAGSVMGGGVGETVILCIILGAAGYFIFSYRSSHESRREREQNKERRCYLLPWILVLILSFFMPAASAEVSLESQSVSRIQGVILFALVLFIFSVFLYAEYFHEKYLTIYANPSVSPEMLKRFEKNTLAGLKRKLMTAGIAALTIGIIAAAGMSTNVELDSVPRERQEQKEIERKEKTKSYPMKARQREIVKETEEERSSFVQVLLYVLEKFMQILMLLFLIIAVLWILYIILKGLLNFRLPEFVWSEENKEVEMEGMDEYISLRQTVRREVSFPEDANGRIRRCFYRYIWKRAGKQVDVSMTPWELAGEYLPEEQEDGLTEEQRQVVILYEKARYSGKECTEEEAERVRKICLPKRNLPYVKCFLGHPLFIFGVLLIEFPSIFHIFQDIAEIKGGKIILGSLAPSDHLYTAVFFQKKFRGFEFAIVIISHGIAVGPGVVDHKIISDLNLWKQAVHCEFVIVFTEGTSNIVFVVAGLIFFAKNGDVVVSTVHRRTHKVTGTGVYTGVFFVDMFLVNTFGDEIAIGTQHKSSQLREDRHIPQSGGDKDFFKLRSDTLANYFYIIWLFVRRVGDSDAAGEIDKPDVGSGFFF